MSISSRLISARRFRILGLLGAGFIAASNTSAQLTVIFQQRFDTLAQPWASTGAVTPLSTSGNPTLQNAQLAPIAGNVYSAFFSGSASEFGVPANSFGSSGGYGIELWVRSGALTSSTYAPIVSFGNPLNSGAGDGLAITLSGGGTPLLGAEVFNATPSTPFSAATPGGAGAINGWDHVAVVYDGITTTTFFVNGAAQGTFNGIPATPSTSWHLFVKPGGGVNFTGYVDDLKYFTFATGTFSAGQLDYYSAIPEPSACAMLLGLGVLGTAVWYRRSART